MYRPVEVKICGLTNEEDVELALSSGADYFGFIVYAKSPRGVSLKRAVELSRRVPEGRRVLVGVETATDELERHREAGFDFFQIHCGLQVGMATLAAWSGIVGAERLWLAPRVPPGEAFPEGILTFTDNVLVDTYDPNRAGGTGRVGDWSRFRDWRESYVGTRFILAGGLAPENVQEAIGQSGAECIDVNSGVERAPGRKDAEKMKRLFEIVRP